MAKETELDLYQGTDHQYIYSILNIAETTAINIAGWALSWMVKKYRSDADVSALLTKTTTAASIVISGTFNADPAVNTQVATVTVVDTDSTALPEAVEYHELKRTDDGFETVLSFGVFILRQGVHR